jgi:hypothetical protein
MPITMLLQEVLHAKPSFMSESSQQRKNKCNSIPDKEWQKQGLAPILQLTEIDVVIPFFQTYKEQIP